MEIQKEDLVEAGFKKLSGEYYIHSELSLISFKPYYATNTFKVISENETELIHTKDCLKDFLAKQKETECIK